MPSLLDRVQTIQPASRQQIEERPTSPVPVFAPAPPQPKVSPVAASVAQAKLRQWLIEHILTGFSAPDEIQRDEKTIALLHERFTALYTSAGVNLSPEQVQQLEHLVLDEIVGFGPIEPLLDDPTVTEIM
ncbi:MAG TPA: hypothetical protein VF478_02950, partial [Anaerolineae bacterium]